MYSTPRRRAESHFIYNLIVRNMEKREHHATWLSNNSFEAELCCFKVPADDDDDDGGSLSKH